MKYYKAKVYIKNKIRPLFIAIFEKEEGLLKFVNLLNEEVNFLHIGSIVLKKEVIKYVKIKEVHIKK